MQIKDFLAAADVSVGVRAADKGTLLKDLSTRAATALNLHGDAVFAEIQKREAVGSTGIGGGVAMPHARIDGLKSCYGIAVRLEAPIDFEAIDGHPVDLVFFLILPGTAAEGLQLSALACIARKLRDPDVVEALRRADNAGAFYRTVTA